MICHNPRPGSQYSSSGEPTLAMNDLANLARPGGKVVITVSDTAGRGDMRQVQGAKGSLEKAMGLPCVETPLFKNDSPTTVMDLGYGLKYDSVRDIHAGGNAVAISATKPFGSPFSLPPAPELQEAPTDPQADPLAGLDEAGQKAVQGIAKSSRSGANGDLVEARKIYERAQVERAAREQEKLEKQREQARLVSSKGKSWEEEQVRLKAEEARVRGLEREARQHALNNSREEQNKIYESILRARYSGWITDWKQIPEKDREYVESLVRDRVGDANEPSLQDIQDAFDQYTFERGSAAQERQDIQRFESLSPEQQKKWQDRQPLNDNLLETRGAVRPDAIAIEKEDNDLATNIFATCGSDRIGGPLPTYDQRFHTHTRILNTSDGGYRISYDRGLNGYAGVPTGSSKPELDAEAISPLKPIYNENGKIVDYQPKNLGGAQAAVPPSTPVRSFEDLAERFHQLHPHSDERPSLEAVAGEVERRGLPRGVSNLLDGDVTDQSRRSYLKEKAIHDVLGNPASHTSAEIARALVESGVSSQQAKSSLPLAEKFFGPEHQYTEALKQIAGNSSSKGPGATLREALIRKARESWNTTALAHLNQTTEVEIVSKLKLDDPDAIYRDPVARVQEFVWKLFDPGEPAVQDVMHRAFDGHSFEHCQRQLESSRLHPTAQDALRIYMDERARLTLEGSVKGVDPTLSLADLSVARNHVAGRLADLGLPESVVRAGSARLGSQIAKARDKLEARVRMREHVRAVVDEAGKLAKAAGNIAMVGLAPVALVSVPAILIAGATAKAGANFVTGGIAPAVAKALAPGGPVRTVMLNVGSFIVSPNAVPGRPPGRHFYMGGDNNIANDAFLAAHTATLDGSHVDAGPSSSGDNDPSVDVKGALDAIGVAGTAFDPSQALRDVAQNLPSSVHDSQRVEEALAGARADLQDQLVRGALEGIRDTLTSPDPGALNRLQGAIPPSVLETPVVQEALADAQAEVGNRRLADGVSRAVESIDVASSSPNKGALEATVQGMAKKILSQPAVQQALTEAVETRVGQEAQRAEQAGAERPQQPVEQDKGKVFSDPLNLKPVLERPGEQEPKGEKGEKGESLPPIPVEPAQGKLIKKVIGLLVPKPPVEGTRPLKASPKDGVNTADRYGDILYGDKTSSSSLPTGGFTEGGYGGVLTGRPSEGNLEPGLAEPSWRGSLDDRAKQEAIGEKVTVDSQTIAPDAILTPAQAIKEEVKSDDFRPGLVITGTGGKADTYRHVEVLSDALRAAQTSRAQLSTNKEGSNHLSTTPVVKVDVYTGNSSAPPASRGTPQLMQNPPGTDVVGYEASQAPPDAGNVAVVEFNVHSTNTYAPPGSVSIPANAVPGIVGALGELSPDAPILSGTET